MMLYWNIYKNKSEIKYKMKKSAKISDKTDSRM